MPIDTEKPKHDTVMDVTEEQVARVYAKAFMGVVSTTGDATALVGEVESFVQDVVGKLPQLDAMLKSSLVSEEQKEQLLDRALKGRSSATVLNFLKVLARHDRLTLLRSIARLLRKLDAQRRGLTDVEIRVAAPIDDTLRGEIENRLRKTIGGEPVLHVSVDPALIAGIVIRIGDRVYDGSVSTQLERARRAMIERATEKIETTPERFISA